MTNAGPPHSPDAPDFRDSADFRDSDPRWLASLMDGADAAVPAWRAEELGVILRHQMEAPVQVDLENLGEGAAEQVKTLTAARGLLLRSFGDLLHHPRPPLRLLELAKEFAKANRSHPDSPVPREVASVLYYACIVVARARCGKRISRLSDDALRRGVAWALDQPWLDDGTRSLFRAAEGKGEGGGTADGEGA